MLLLLALSIGIVGMVEKDMHGEWVVVQQQGIRAARTGGIGIIASLLLLRGRRHTLYAFVNWTLWPALRALSGWIRSGLCRARQARLEHAQSYHRQADPSHHSG